jgi:hypothetical protein
MTCQCGQYELPCTGEPVTLTTGDGSKHSQLVCIYVDIRFMDKETARWEWCG